jgi:hypothetical protein
MPPHRNNSNGFLTGVAGVLVLAALAGWLWHRRMEPMSPVETPAVSAVTTSAGSSPVVSAAPVAPFTAASLPIMTSGSLQKVHGSLQTAPDAAATRKQLAELRATLSALPTNEAVAVIRQFLDSKADASTQLGFKVGSGGLLDESPTLRTFLLDEMTRLDPAAAADYAKVILASKDSPDEWAVALRNLARGDDSNGGRQLLKQKASEMLQYEPWQKNPSVGFLEAFDVAVYLGGDGLMPALTQIIQQQDNPAVAHASYLALDRLVINEPVTTLNLLLADMDSMPGRELTRADYFSRADVRDPQQRQILENYLLNPKTTAAELDAFANIFPNANFMVSPNLLTPSPTIDRATLLDRDQESLRVANAWLADPRFASLSQMMQTTITRLEGFVRQSNAGN